MIAAAQPTLPPGVEPEEEEDEDPDYDCDSELENGTCDDDPDLMEANCPDICPDSWWTF